jgi:hypothetical protein
MVERGINGRIGKYLADRFDEAAEIFLRVPTWPQLDQLLCQKVRGKPGALLRCDLNLEPALALRLYSKEKSSFAVRR